MPDVLYEATLPCPSPSTYEQHQFLDRVFVLLDEERRILIANGHRPSRNYLWTESDGLLYLRRSKPTQEVPWHPADVPVAGTMINFQLKARCRGNVIEDVRLIPEPPRLERQSRTILQDPGDCLEWLERNAAWMGLRIEDAEVEEVQKWIGKKSISRRFGEQDGFFVSGSQFEGIAEVLDPALFERGLIRGLGDSKAFGFGYMFFWRRGRHNAA